MNSSKFPQGSDESSDGESGWTAYIASPHNQEDDQNRSKDGEEDMEEEEEAAEEEEEAAANSDDSMASDASSRPSYQYGHLNKEHGFGHATNRNERKRAGEKEQKQENMRQHAEKIKAAKDKADKATRSKKK